MFWKYEKLYFLLTFPNRLKSGLFQVCKKDSDVHIIYNSR